MARKPRFKSYAEQLGYIQEQKEVAEDVLRGRLSPAERMKWNRYGNQLIQAERIARAGVGAESAGVPYSAIRKAQDVEGIRTASYEYFRQRTERQQEEQADRLAQKRAELDAMEEANPAHQVRARDEAIREEVGASGQRLTIEEWLRRGGGMNDEQYERHLEGVKSARAREALRREDNQYAGYSEALDKLLDREESE